MLCPIHAPQTTQRQSASEVAHQHQRMLHNQHQNASRLARYAANPDYDPQLLKPVHLTPPPPMSEAERARLHSELRCLKRERDTTQEAIDHLLEKLAA